MATPAWISLGSNLGDRRAILDAAVVALSETPGVAVRAVSSYHQTQPVGGPPGQGPFLNAAAELVTDLSPHEFLATLQAIENQAGRVRTVRWGERTLDLDVLIYATKFLDTKDLKLPHPRLAFRRFVLEPLAEIAPAIVDTMTRRTVADLLANLGRSPRLLAIDGSPGPIKRNVFQGLVERLPAIGIPGDGWQADQGEDPGRRRESIAVNAEAMQVDRRGEEIDPEYWGVANFFPDPSSIKLILKPNPMKSVVIRSISERVAQEAARTEWEARIWSADSRAREPMFVVILPGEQPLSRKPGLARVPQFWPESDEPDAIVAEVVATCRGIDGRDPSVLL